MSTKKDPAKSRQTTGNITPSETDAGAKRLRLNKQTLQDLSPTDDVADKVRGGRKLTDTDWATCSCHGGCL